MSPASARRTVCPGTSPYKPSVIAEDVPQTAIFTIRERQEDFPGVQTLTLPVRTYPFGTLAAQILFRRIDGDTSQPQCHIVPTRLIPRGSGEIPPP